MKLFRIFTVESPNKICILRRTRLSFANELIDTSYDQCFQSGVVAPVTHTGRYHLFVALTLIIETNLCWPAAF